MRHASSAAEGMCRWVRAMEQYDAVSSVVRPKRKAVEEAQRALDVKMEELKRRQDNLDEVEAQLAKLQRQLQESVAKKAELERDVESCKVKLRRARQIIDSLGGEATRWGGKVQETSQAYATLTGDVLVAAGFMAYLGVYTVEVRQMCLLSWTAMVAAAGLPSSTAAALVGDAAVSSPSAAVARRDAEQSSSLLDQGFSLAGMLSTPLQLQRWHMEGLPVGAFSEDNATIVAHSQKWPLMIDPQGQARKWIAGMHDASMLKVVHLSDRHLMRTLENAVQYGQPVLLEDVGEDLDPLLDPILS